jgi:DNA polymerase-3 subunit gamma/tau
MSYLVLARKYRPRVFSDVVGQEVATATLRGAIEEKRIGHAYLFCGPRGTGKTTTARIFAKALNCEQGPRADPCGTCERCRSTEDGSEVDIVEIDAASNRGIDDIRGLRESASYRPMRARFKIFLVDEAHMLTKEAVNAFLKTLEEPPPHVKLFFATTEPEKLLPTFVSRCQLVRLVLISEEAIAARLSHVFAQEGIQAGPGVAEELARRSRGGLRDALSLADQLISLVGGAPALADLARLSGGAGREEVEALFDRVEAGDKRGALAALPAVEGTERELLSGLCSSLRDCLLVGLAGTDHPLVEADATARSRMRERFERLGCDRVQAWLAELLRARERIELLKAVPARLILEMTLLDLCRPETTMPLAEMEERLLALESRLGSAGAAALREVPVRKIATPGADPGATAPAPAPAPTGPVGIGETWNRLLASLDVDARTLGEILRAHGRLETCDAGRAVVRLGGMREDERAVVTESRNTRLVSAALSKLLGRKIEVLLQGSEPVVAAKRSTDLFTQKVADSFGGRIVEEK